MKQPHKKGMKKGLSPIVLILLLMASISVILFVFSLQKRKQNILDSPIPPSESENTMTPILPDIESTPTEPITPVDPPDDDNETVKLSVQNKRIHLNSGGEIIYGYPTLTITENPEAASRINEKLHDLVENTILPVIHQLQTEDHPDTFREYMFSLSEGCGLYSIIVSVDIYEGITPAREIYGWNVLEDTGDYVGLNSHCSDRKKLATIIDGCIENLSSYDQIIHEWLTQTLTGEYESEEFSFYFEKDNMIAVLNKHLRIDSFDRDPILITVPFSKISDIFPISTERN